MKLDKGRIGARRAGCKARRVAWGFGWALLLCGVLGCHDAGKRSVERADDAREAGARRVRALWGGGETVQAAGKKQRVVLEVSQLWARVYVDGSMVGLSSYLPSGRSGIAFRYSSGKATVRVEKKGFVPLSRRISLGQVPAPFVLRRAPSSAKGPASSGELARLRDALKRAPQRWKLHKRYHQALLRAGQEARALGHLRRWRAWSPRSVYLLKEQYRLTKKRDPAKAALLLSEWTEFASTSSKRWLSYAAFLRGEQKHAASCLAYAQAIQLNPTATSLFREMMSVRRKHPTSAEAIERCILQGVSQMPVERRLTILMMWKQDKTDIDLWVTEPGGEEVGYSHKRSRAGGVLYYDVTKGFGPEIFVNAEKHGRYRLRVNYYAGKAPKVKVRLLVLRDAGTDRETRKEFHVTLTRKDRGANKKRHVAWINIPKEEKTR